MNAESQNSKSPLGDLGVFFLLSELSLFLAVSLIKF